MSRVRFRTLPALALLAAALLLPCRGAGQSLPRPETVVEPSATVSLEKVPQGRAFEIAVRAGIKPGFHINAHKPLEDYLIPTSLEAELPKGFRVLAVAYPPGKLEKFEFSETKLLVYDGTITVRMRLQALAEAPLGRIKLPLTLRYQACNDVACLPPVRKPVPVEVEVVAQGTPVRPKRP
jgi:DsbC/DsbD-like thiol-disulfide interchange protein